MDTFADVGARIVSRGERDGYELRTTRSQDGLVEAALALRSAVESSSVADCARLNASHDQGLLLRVRDRVEGTTWDRQRYKETRADICASQKGRRKRGGQRSQRREQRKRERGERRQERRGEEGEDQI